MQIGATLHDRNHVDMMTLPGLIAPNSFQHGRNLCIRGAMPSDVMNMALTTYAVNTVGQS